MRARARARGCSHCEINEFFTMDTLTVAGPGQQKQPRCFMTTMRAILRKDERDDKLDLLSRSGRGEFMANASRATRERERER